MLKPLFLMVILEEIYIEQPEGFVLPKYEKKGMQVSQVALWFTESTKTMA